jgi:hypothetical protein
MKESFALWRVWWRPCELWHFPSMFTAALRHLLTAQTCSGSLPPPSLTDLDLSLISLLVSKLGRQSMQAKCPSFPMSLPQPSFLW